MATLDGSPPAWDLSDDDFIMHGGEGVEQPPSSDTDHSVYVETPSPSESPGKLNTAIFCPVTVALRKLETLLSQSSLDNADNRIPLAARFREEFQERFKGDVMFRHRSRRREANSLPLETCLWRDGLLHAKQTPFLVRVV